MYSHVILLNMYMYIHMYIIIHIYMYLYTWHVQFTFHSNIWYSGMLPNAKSSLSPSLFSLSLFLNTVYLSLPPPSLPPLSLFPILVVSISSPALWAVCRAHSMSRLIAQVHIYIYDNVHMYMELIRHDHVLMWLNTVHLHTVCTASTQKGRASTETSNL